MKQTISNKSDEFIRPIKLYKSTWKSLYMKKLEYDCKTLDETIQKLIEKVDAK